LINPYEPSDRGLTETPLTRADQSRHWLALGCAIGYPTILTWAYFVLLREHPAAVQQTVYTAGKTLQFIFPVVWVYWILRQPWVRPHASRRGLGLGLAFGAAVLVGMFGLYSVWLKGSEFGPGLDAQAVEKVRDLGLDSLWKFGAVAVFYALAHSLLEEYYWRWFVYGQLQRTMRPVWAIGISSLGFMAHHVILLATYFGWASPLTYLFSLGVALGGAFWAWLYWYSRSLLAPWLSHMLVDIAIFVIGYDLVRELF
jgi:membrane protease YdiL (CAAX protease family)